MKTTIIFLALLYITYGDVLISPLLPRTSVLEQIPVKAVEGICSDTKMTLCQHQFNRDLGISGDADFRHYDILRNDLDDILKQGVDDGLLKVCKARSDFYTCLNVYYKPCMNRVTFLKRGMNLTEATAYVQLFNELEFMCGGGLLQSIQKWDCILANSAAASDSMKNCRDLYYQQALTDKNCDAAEQLMLCYRIPFYKNCGEDVAWWTCEQARVALNIDDYCPHLSCSYDTFGPSQAPSGTHPAGELNVPQQDDHHLLTRREAFQSLNPQFMKPEKMQLYAELGRKAAEKERKKRSVDDF